MEIVARWKKQSQAVPTILKYVDVLQQEVKLALGVSELTANVEMNHVAEMRR